MHLVESRYERREFAGDPAGFVNGLPHVVGIGCRAATVPGYLPFDEPAECSADRCCAQAAAIGRPDLIAHLDSRHPVAWSSCTFLGLLFTLSSASSHVYVVDDVADALEE